MAVQTFIQKTLPNPKLLRFDLFHLAMGLLQSIFESICLFGLFGRDGDIDCTDMSRLKKALYFEGRHV